MMKFETKYNLGDKVYRVQKTQVYLDCSMCEGLGKVQAQVREKEYEVACPKCKGYKKEQISRDSIWNVLEEVFVGVGNASPKAEAIFVINQVIITENGIFYKISLYNEDSRLSRFTIERLTKVVDEREIFPSKEEAQEFCYKMNGMEPLIERGKLDV